jgi:GAF domain-containing protein
MGRTEAEPSWPTVLDDVTAALQTLTLALDTDDDLAALLQGVCEQVTGTLPGIDAATVTMLAADGSPETAAATSPLATELDQKQYEWGDGPCLRAARTGQLVRVSVAEAADQWPVFAASAGGAGFGSFLSAPLSLDDEHAGAVNCYSTEGHGFAELDVKLLSLYTKAVEAALSSHRRYVRARRTAEQLQAALASRAVIDQAKGIVMAVRRVNAEQAFALLVEQSQRDNVKLKDLAARFVARASGADDEDGNGDS